MRIYSSETTPYFAEYREHYDYRYDDLDDPILNAYDPTDYPAYSGEFDASAYTEAQLDAVQLDLVVVEKRFLDHEAGLQFPEAV